MNTGKDQYKSYRIPVPPEFEDVFSHFYAAENLTSYVIRKTFLPSFQTIFIFSFGTGVCLESNLKHQIKLDKCIVLGPVKQPITYSLPVGAEILVANFKSDAFYRFFGHSLASGHIMRDPDELLDENCFTELWNKLRLIHSSDERVAYILEFCKPYLKTGKTGFESFGGSNSVFDPIKVMALETNRSERTIQLHHKKLFGFSAKEVARYQRFLKAMELLQLKPTNVDWFEIIHECGYYDQSQLIHDFKHYLNLSPTKFLKFQEDICIARPD